MQRLPRHEGRSLREGGNLVPHPAPYFQGNWFPGARPPSLHAADPGGGQAQAGSHLELVGGVGGGGHSPSRREGPTGQVGAGGRRLHLTPGTLRLTEQPRQEARLLKVAPPSPCDRLSPPGENCLGRRQFTGQGLNLQVSESQVGFKFLRSLRTSPFTCQSLRLPTCNRGYHRVK